MLSKSPAASVLLLPVGLRQNQLVVQYVKALGRKMATHTCKQTLEKKNTFCHWKLQGGFLHCLFLGLALPKGKEPFHPSSVLGTHLPSVRSRLCCQLAFLLLSDAGCLPLTSTSWWPAAAAPHFGRHRSWMSGKEAKPACQEHTIASQFKGQRSPRCERHRM